MDQGTLMQEKGLGYHWIYDPKAAAFRMADMLDPEAFGEGGPVMYERGPILDQGREGACVAFGHGAVTNAGPTRPATLLGNADCQRLYKRAQDLDEWAGNDYEGTSNIAGAKAYREAGYYEKFVWAANPTEMAAYIRAIGPVTFTCKWRKGMYQTDRDGYLTPSGDVVGGHLMALIGILANGDYVGQNSWGEDFGKGGLFYMKPQVMHALYAEGHWTSCAPSEVGQKVDPKPEPQKIPTVWLSDLEKYRKTEWFEKPIVAESRKKGSRS